MRRSDDPLQYLDNFTKTFVPGTVQQDTTSSGEERGGPTHPLTVVLLLFMLRLLRLGSVGVGGHHGVVRPEVVRVEL